MRQALVGIRRGIYEHGFFPAGLTSRNARHWTWQPPNRSARYRIRAAFALPSTGTAVSLSFNRSPLNPTTWSREARGMTRTCSCRASGLLSQPAHTYLEARTSSGLCRSASRTASTEKSRPPIGGNTRLTGFSRGSHRRRSIPDRGLCCWGPNQLISAYTRRAKK